jgi:hypothetical protein
VQHCRYHPILRVGLLAALALSACNLASRPSPTPNTPLEGSVLLEDGKCCVGAVAGEEVLIHATIDASRAATQMRVGSGFHALSEDELAETPWEPISTSKVFSYRPPINWTGFYVTVQFRNNGGNVSVPYSDDISVEGMPAGYPLSTP